MAAVELQVDLAPLLTQIKTARRAIRVGVERGMRTAGQWAAREAKEDAPVSTGQLRRSIAAKVTRDELRFRLEVGIGVPGVKNSKPLVYARIQDVGGVVEPKPGGAKKLAIPVHKKLRTKKARVSGVRARDVLRGIDTGDNSYSHGFFSYSFTKRAILGWRPVGGKGKMRSEVLFARKDSVYIPGTKYLMNPRRDLRGGRLRDFIAASVRAEMAKQAGGGGP